MHYAVAANDADSAALFIRHNVPIESLDPKNGYTPLLEAVEKNHLAVARTLVQFGTQVNVRDRLLRTPLLLAVTLNEPKIVELLITHQADLSARTADGKSALPLARENNFDAIEESLTTMSAPE